MSPIELPYVKIEYRSPVVYYTYRKDTELGFPEVLELIDWAEKMSGGTPYVTLADAREGLSITQQGKNYATDLGKMPLFRGTAVLVNSSLAKFAANIMVEMMDKGYPYKVFTSMDRAEEWLRALPLHWHQEG